jgi:DNA-binding transcriptional regulator YiaG
MDNNNYLGKNVKILRESYAIDEKLFAETLGISIEELIHLEHSRNINKKILKQ